MRIEGANKFSSRKVLLVLSILLILLAFFGFYIKYNNNYYKITMLGGFHSANS